MKRIYGSTYNKAISGSKQQAIQAARLDEMINVQNLTENLEVTHVGEVKAIMNGIVRKFIFLACSRIYRFKKQYRNFRFDQDR
jgi:hypothetical protein